MNKTRFAVKAFAGAMATTVLVLGAFAAPAEAKKDTGWDVNGGVQTLKKDTGWD
jgi:hypothetical protein